MINAEAARTISLKCKFTYIESLIKTAANKGSRCISLMGENIYLGEDEIKELNGLGYKVRQGQSGKYGAFDIISW